MINFKNIYNILCRIIPFIYYVLTLCITIFLKNCFFIAMCNKYNEYILLYCIMLEILVLRRGRHHYC